MYQAVFISQATLLLYSDQEEERAREKENETM